MKLIDAATGKTYDVPDAEVEEAKSKYGLQDPAAIAAEERSGGANVQTGLEEAGRKVVSGSAALARGIEGASVSDEALAQLAAETGQEIPAAAVGTPTDVTGADIAPALYTPEARERREANPTAAAIGGSIPLAAAEVALGPAGGMLAGVADAAAQDATDAEIEGRGISAEHVLRNAALNTVFSGAAQAVPYAVRSLMRGTGNLVERGAKAAAAKLEESGLKTIARKAEAAVKDSASALDSTVAPRVANNPNAQREALESLVEAFQGESTEAAKQLDELIKASPKQRFEALAEMRETAGPELATTLDETLSRAELWGSRAVQHAQDVRAARGLVPGPTGDAAAWQAYADALRRLPGKQFQKQADLLDELAGMKALDGLSSSGGALDGAAGTVADMVTRRGVRTAATVAGGAVGGWPGAAIGHVVGESLEPAAEAAAGALKPTFKAGFVRAAQALKDLAENDTRQTARLMVDMKAAERFARVAGDEVANVYRRFQGEHDSPQQAFEARRRAIEGYQRNPALLVDALAEEFGDVDDLSPELHRQMTAKAMQVAAFLYEKMPQRRGVSVARPNGSPVSPMQLRQFALYETAATDPESVFADARAGRLRREQVTTLERLWPERYNELKTAVLEQLGEGRSSTTTRQRMNLLFGFGAGLDAALGPKVQRLVADARGRKAQEDAKKGATMAAKSPPSEAAMAPAGMQAMQLSGTGGR